LNTECDVKKEIENDTGGANVGVDISTQTDLTTNTIEDMSHNSECYEQKHIGLMEEGMQPFTEKAFRVNGKEYVKFYTGLPNYGVLHTVFDFVAPPATQRTKLTPFQEFALTLIKLRLDLPFQDLAYRFGLSVTTVSRIFSKWLWMYGSNV